MMEEGEEWNANAFQHGCVKGTAANVPPPTGQSLGRGRKGDKSPKGCYV